MTPEQAQEIYHSARMIEYARHQADYFPVNQEKTILAGFKAVIDAVSNEVHTGYAIRYLDENAVGGENGGH